MKFAFWKKDNRIVPVILILVSAVAVMVRIYFRNWISGDWIECLEPWIRGLQGTGLEGIAQYEGNYNVPYVTVLWVIANLPINPLHGVKIFSCVFDFVCAYALSKMVFYALGRERRALQASLICYSVVLLSPITVGNGAVWAQCDSVYTSFVLMALLSMLEGKNRRAMLLWGIAFSFKLQAVLIFPLALLLWFKNKRFSFLEFLWIPLAMEIMCIPAIIGGCSPFVTIDTYLGQVAQYPAMYMFYPNVWGILRDIPYWAFGRMAMLGTMGVLIVALFYVIRIEAELTFENFLPYAVWVLMSVLMFLPCMHERYGFALEMLFVAFSVVYWNKWYLCVVMHATILVFYLPTYLGRWVEVDSRITSSVYIAIYVVLTWFVVLRRRGVKKNVELGTQNSGMDRT